MPERLHIDEIKRIEKSTNALIRSWKKLNRDYAQLKGKYDALEETLNRSKSAHEAEIAGLQRESDEIEEKAKIERTRALADVEAHWQQKYDQARQQHEQKIVALYEQYQNELQAAQQKMAEREKALEAELAQVKKVKDVLTNRVLGVES